MRHVRQLNRSKSTNYPKYWCCRYNRQAVPSAIFGSTRLVAVLADKLLAEKVAKVEIKPLLPYHLFEMLESFAEARLSLEPLTTIGVGMAMELKPIEWSV